MFWKSNITGERFDFAELFNRVFRFVDGFFEVANGFELLRLCEDDKVVGSELLEVVLDEIWLKFFHIIGVDQHFIDLSFMQMLS